MERRQKRALDVGDFVEPSSVRLGEYLTEWLDGPVQLKVRESTLHGYRRLLDRYVMKSDVATMPLARLTTQQIEALYATLSAKGLSARTVRFTHSVLHAALKKAERDRRILRNPATGATLPRQVRTEMQVLTVAQKARLLAVSEATGNKWHALWHLLANSGLRPGEALALRWSEVAADRVQVWATLVRGLPGGGWKLTEPKTTGSRRTVTLPEGTMQALAWHRVRQEAEKETAGSRYVDHGLVFAGELGQPLDLKNVTLRHFKPLLDAYYPLPRIEVYALRHTHATHLLSMNVPVKVVSERLGHASAMMTLNVYAHLLPGQQEDAVAKMEACEAAR